MRPSQYLYLADVLREHRERLEQVSTELAERGTPITELEAHLLADAGTARLLEVENALRHEAHSSGRQPLAPRVGGRIRSWTKPRIGRLRHYEPKPILLPRSYFQTQPPTPAPTISIVTPSFNQGRFIDRTVYSVVSQGYPALDYHVQDGGSSDETLDVLQRFENVLTSYVSEPDSGQAEAINRGFARTTSEIMAWLNSDDLLLPGSLASVATYFATHPEVDVVYGNRLMIDEEDGQIGAWILPAHDDRALTLADYVPQETLIWRRRIWDEAGGFVDARLRYAMDWELLLRFREAGARMAHIPRFLGAFRVHDAQKTTSLSDVGLAECSLLRERVHGRHVPVDEVLRELRPFFVRHILVHNCQRLRDLLPQKRTVVRTVPPASALPSTDAMQPAPGDPVDAGSAELPGTAVNPE